jgi:hypothetical protein
MRGPETGVRSGSSAFKAAGANGSLPVVSYERQDSGEISGQLDGGVGGHASLPDR